MCPISLETKSLAFIFNDPEFQTRDEYGYLSNWGKLVDLIQAIYAPIVGDSRGRDHDFLDEHVKLNQEFVAVECLKKLELITALNWHSLVYLVKNKGFLIVDLNTSPSTPSIYFLPLHDRPMEFASDLGPENYPDCRRLPID